MSKHTPGRWKLQNYRMYASQMAKAEYPIHAPKRGLIAKAYRESDARLMASAPDLIAALIDCVEHMEHNTPQGKLAYENAKSEIIKATGGIL